MFMLEQESMYQNSMENEMDDKTVSLEATEECKFGIDYIFDDGSKYRMCTYSDDQLVNINLCKLCNKKQKYEKDKS